MSSGYKLGEEPVMSEAERLEIKENFLNWAEKDKPKAKISYGKKGKRKYVEVKR
ncbi:hypothetical protein [Acetobacterium wieringae]|uniref:hypothetical protein n=1 Tax=Acetobacterium wieringae TaxID=52694 RepID=UPI0031592A46